MKHYATKTYGEVDVYIHVFLTSALVKGDWSDSLPCRFTPGERAPRHPINRRLAEPQSQSGRGGEEKILEAIGTRTPTPMASSP
jgi:hypothetical protein